MELKLNTIAQEDTAFLKARLANGANLKSTKQFYKPMKKNRLNLNTKFMNDTRTFWTKYID